MMNKAYALILGMTVAASSALADSYTIDKAHTTLGFSVKHMVVSSTKGKFQDFTGTIEAGADGVPSKASATIKAASLDTDNEDRDKHLRSPDFFDADKFPEVTFESTKIEKTGDGATITGNLTIRGVTKEIALPVSLSGPVTDPWGNVRIGLEGSTKINRKDFGMIWNKTLDAGGLVVDDTVKIDVSVEAIKDK